MAEVDKDTQKQLSDADHVKSMLDSHGWGYVHSKLTERIQDLQNIYNLDMAKIETLPQQLAARKMAVEIVRDWLQKDVFGFVEQQEKNSVNLAEKAAEFIERV